MYITKIYLDFTVYILDIVWAVFDNIIVIFWIIIPWN